jgi:hypothetical protein
MARRVWLGFGWMIGAGVALTIASPAEAQEAPAKGVVVNIDGPDYSKAPTLEQAFASGSGVGWSTVCVAPCNIAIDPSVSYRIHGGEITTTSQITDSDGSATGAFTSSTSRALDSAPFQLSPDRPQQTLHVDANSSGAWGWIFVGVSPAYFVPASIAFAGKFSDDRNFNKTFRWAFGLPMAACGLAFATVGLLIVTQKTHVTDDAGRKLARSTSGVHLTPQGLVF